MRTARSSSRPGGLYTPAPPPDQAPPCGQNSWHTLLKILPCPKLRLRAVIKHSKICCYLWILFSDLGHLNFKRASRTWLLLAQMGHQLSKLNDIPENLNHVLFSTVTIFYYYYSIFFVIVLFSFTTNISLFISVFTCTSGCSVLMLTAGFFCMALLDAPCPVSGWLLRCNAAAILCNKHSVPRSGPAAKR